MPKGFSHVFLLLSIAASFLLLVVSISYFKSQQLNRSLLTQVTTVEPTQEKITPWPANPVGKVDPDEKKCEETQNNTAKQSLNDTSYRVTNSDIGIQFDYSKNLYFHSEYLYQEDKDQTIYGCLLLIQLGYPSEDVGPDGLNEEYLFEAPFGAVEHKLTIRVTNNHFAALDDYYKTERKNTLDWYEDYNIENPYITDIKENIFIDGEKCLKWTYHHESITDSLTPHVSYICIVNSYIYVFDAYSFKESSPIFTGIKKTIENAKFLN